MSTAIKNLLIIGDSYSTFEGYIPEGYSIYYVKAGRENSDVNAVEQTWWHSLCSELGIRIVRNDSWSGSTIGFTGYNGADTSQTSSFIHRVEKLTSEGFFASNEIDTVFVFGGTNDSWSNAPLGTLKPEGHDRKDLYEVCPAIGYFAKLLRETLPNGRIVYLINTGLKPEISSTLRIAAEHSASESLAFTSIDKTAGHPTVKGMQDICGQIKTYLANS